MKIALLGAGNMGSALVAGWVSAKIVRAQNIVVSDPDRRKLKDFAFRYGVRTAANNRKACADSDVVFLCVKPPQVPEVLEEVKSVLSRRAWVVSVAAGVRTEQMGKILGPVPVIRVMPNTPALVGAGAMVYCRGRHAGAQHDRQARSLLTPLGKVWKVNEPLLDAVTALSGSGPAYVFYLAEAMAQAGRKLGLPLHLAEELARQTVFGAGKMLAGATETPAELRRRVTSPGGTTEAAISVLERRNFLKVFAEALSAARNRSRALSAPKEMKP